MTDEFLLIPQKDVSPTALFDLGCYESRVREYAERILSILVDEDVKQHAVECRKCFEPVTPYPYSEEEVRKRFYETARQEAVKIVEQERKLCVEARKTYIRNTLNLIIKQARLLVYVGEKKGKICRKRVPIIGRAPPGSDGFCDKFYFEEDCEAGTQRYELITRLKGRLAEFEPYLPYLDSEVIQLWKEANELLTLEVVDADAKEKI